MIPNVVRGSHFRGALDYLFDVKQGERSVKKPTLVCSNMAGSTPWELAAEFAVFERMNAKASKPVLHLSLSAHPNDRLTLEQWDELVLRFMALFGEQVKEESKERPISAELNQFVAVRHSDHDHDHVHLLLNRINLAGEVCYCKWDQNRAQAACRQLEHEFGLTLVAGKTEAEKTAQRTLAQAARVAKAAGLPVPAACQRAPKRLSRKEIARLERQQAETGVVDPRLQAYQEQRQLETPVPPPIAVEPALILESVTQAAVEPALILALEPQPVAIEPALEPIPSPDPLELQIEPQPVTLEPVAIEPVAIEPVALEPVAVAPALEKTEPNDEEVQQLCSQKLPSLVAEIWRYYQERYPKGFKLGDYRFAPGESNSPPTLFKHGTKQLEWLPTEKRYQVEGLTLADYEAIQRHAEKVRSKSIKTVAPLMAKFLEQKGVKRWEDTDSTYGLSREGDLLTYYKQQERTIVYQAKLKEERWTPITGRVPPEVAQIWLTWQSQEKKTPVKGSNGR